MENDMPAKIKPDYKVQARRQLSGNWGIAIGFTLIYAFIPIILVALINLIFHINIQSVSYVVTILVSPLVLSSVIFYSRLSKKKTVSVGTIFSGFKYLIASSVIYLVLNGLMIINGLVAIYFPGDRIFILMFIAIVTCFITLYYRMSYYIIAVEDNISVTKALAKSKKNMYGHKMELFLLELSYIGWVFVSLVTLGIALLWIVPYMELTLANFFLNNYQPEAEQLY
ncbi:DUF975 family protein [Clostridium estertheticum]|uniref:DUF975 family protein n=1 Tax=Clostridium estertheticum TaxID=238834 RepID=A0AA47EMA9_9CLOT|nr:DUF975 family protein [Clostridium estertheticum]MBU3156690.1 DUF975 family protein [Clostridium estertheticum]WAG62730.1 DUF975 family protein [Clostridium estertheticum]